jgi:integral membrane protein
MLRTTLGRWRLVALIVGTGLFILTFVAIPLQLAGHPGLVHVVGFLHGVLYMLFVALTLHLGFLRRWPLLKIVLVAASGTIPLLGFYAERRVTAEDRAREDVPA